MLELLIESIKTHRILLDGQIKTMAIHQTGLETSNCLQCLQISKGWLGKVLGCLGEDTPYVSTKNVEDIPATTQQFDKVIEQIDVKDAKAYLAFLHKQRAYMKELNISINSDIHLAARNAQNTGNYSDVNFNKVYRCIELSSENLEEAIMWLGYEVSNLKPKTL